MKKAKVPKPYTSSENLPQVSEPYISPYARAPKAGRMQAAIADFTYKKFEKIAAMVPFTLADWANVLHLSERTLQRYSKDNKNFEGIYVDRILQIEKIFRLGLSVFNTPEAFYQWLKKPKMVMGEPLTFESLYHTDGIYQTLDQLGRIQQGVYA